MKNKTLIIFAVVLIIGFWSVAQNTPTILAQSSNQDLLTIIEQLKNQIKELQDQFAKLTSEVATVKEEIKLTKNLYKGVSGNEVKEVQKFLKQFSEIYPEGLVTGYYGPMTEKAVKKFQERDGLPVTGKIDETTRSKINEYLTGGTAFSAPENIPIKPVDIPTGTAMPTGTTTPPIIPFGLPTPTVVLPTAVNPPTAITGTITPVSAGSVTQFVTLGGYSYGGVYAYGVTTDGSVLCWSVPSYGPDGWSVPSLGPIDSSSLPVLCSLKDIARIAPGYSHSCAVKTDGSAICWGKNQYGQLGNGTYSDPNDKIETPTPVLGLGPGTTADIITDWEHTCALKKDGSVVCWGNGYSGQLGNGTDGIDNPVFIPTQVSGLGHKSTIAFLSKDTNPCVLKTNGAVVCWGSSFFTGHNTQFTPIPASIPTPVAIKYLSGFRKGACVLKTDGSVACWGINNHGQLGDGTTIGKSAFTQVFGLTKGTTADIVTDRDRLTCALKKNGSVVCWGDNVGSGKLGDGTIFRRLTPVSVLGLGAGTTVAISSTSDSVCALKTDGFVVCWPGGKTADGKPTRAPAPVPLIGQK